MRELTVWLGIDLSPLWSPTGLLLMGLCVGSFVNVVAWRLPRILARRWWSDMAWQLEGGHGMDALGGRETAESARHRQLLAQALHQRIEGLPTLSLSWPRSHCPACGHALRWRENLPVLGWLMLRGRCAACGAAISWRYPAVELATGLIFLGMGMRLGFEVQALLWGAWAAALLALSLIDWDTLLLPEELTQPLLWCGLVAAALGWTLPLSDALWGAAGGYAGLWMVAWAFNKVTGKEGMGGGDFKLLAALGAWLGPAALLPVVFLASLTGAAVGLLMKARGTLREGRYVPFGPFLAAGAAVVALSGLEPLLAWTGW